MSLILRVGSPVADALIVPEQVVVNVPTTSVIAVDTVTVCDCGPEVSVPVIDSIGNTVIVPVIVAAGAQVCGLCLDYYLHYFQKW